MNMNHKAASFFFMHMQILLYINKITISYLHSLITKSIYKIRKGVRLEYMYECWLFSKIEA